MSTADSSRQGWSSKNQGHPEIPGAYWGSSGSHQLTSAHPSPWQRLDTKLGLCRNMVFIKCCTIFLYLWFLLSKLQMVRLLSPRCRPALCQTTRPPWSCSLTESMVLITRTSCFMCWRLASYLTWELQPPWTRLVGNKTRQLVPNVKSTVEVSIIWLYKSCTHSV